MGCGGSTFAEDGSVNVGKGEVRMELDEEMKLKILFFYPEKASSGILGIGASGPKMGTEIKGAEGKEIVTAPWVRVSDGQTNTMWADVKPGNYMFRYVVDERRCLHHEDMGLELPQKIWFVHEKAPAVFTKMCYHYSKGKEGCPYAAEGGEKMCEEDLNKMENYVSAHQLGEFLEPLRKALTTIEDVMPGNKLDATLATKFDLGYWDKNESGEIARVLGAMEKGRLLAEAKINNPKQTRMIQLKAAEVIRQMIEKTMDATCKSIKMTKEELLPTLGNLLDVMEGRKPGSIKRPVEGDTTEYPDVTPETMEQDKLNMIEKLWKQDSSAMMKLKAEDMAPEIARKKIQENAMDNLFDKLDKHYKSTFDPSSLKPGDWSMVRYKDTEMFEAQMKEKDGSDAMNFTWPQTKLEEEETLSVKLKETRKIKKGFPPKEVEETRENTASMPPAAASSDLVVGMKVRFRSEKWGNFQDGTVLDVIDGKAVIKDRFNEVDVAVPPERIWLLTKLSDLAKAPKPIEQNFYEVAFWWVESDQFVTSVKLNVWRVGAREETLESINLESVKKPAKPTKQVPEPNTEVHVGFRGVAKVMLGRDYAMNFVKKYKKDLGNGQTEDAEGVFIDFGKEAKDEQAYRRFSMKLNF